MGARSQSTNTWIPGDPDLRFGLYGPGEFRTLMAWMLAQFRERKLMIEGVYHAPTRPPTA